MKAVSRLEQWFDYLSIRDQTWGNKNHGDAQDNRNAYKWLEHCRSQGYMSCVLQEKVWPTTIWHLWCFWVPCPVLIHSTKTEVEELARQCQVLGKKKQEVMPVGSQGKLVQAVIFMFAIKRKGIERLNILSLGGGGYCILVTHWIMILLDHQIAVGVWGWPQLPSLLLFFLLLPPLVTSSIVHEMLNMNRTVSYWKQKHNHGGSFLRFTTCWHVGKQSCFCGAMNCENGQELIWHQNESPMLLSVI